MIINHPLLGPRDAAEFVYKGDASLIDRPDGLADGSGAEFDIYMHLRDNPAGDLEELWSHDAGCGAWLKVVRNTATHAIKGAQLVAEVRR